jgi:Rod binding domain-containing protein
MGFPMAIDPPSDIVLDVARAADPERAAAVASRLANLASSVAPADGDFAATLARTSPASTAASAPDAGAFDMRARLADADRVQGDKASQARIQFEAVLLNSFVSEMLPKDTPSAYGEGMAGDMWRSMLADQVSRKIAASGTLGIGQRLFATHPMSASASLTHAESPSRPGIAAPSQMSANALSAPSAAEITEGSFLFTGSKPI